MLEEIRNLLQKIDQIVDSESRRLSDEIDELKEKIKEMGDSEINLSSIHSQVKEITNENESLKGQLEKTRAKVEELTPLETKCQNLESQISKLELKHEGYIFTIKVIANWIPSQKENIDVLVALSSSANHEATFEMLQKDTTIPSVTLKNRIIPILEDNSLVQVENDVVKLNIKELTQN
ncbi:hypothetical protein EU534_01540 [Candidatus Heimdallarchaeota archaeon]|nr:MAG: hypothetical protein EU534_01540 [Candidatus Heimdallarchaeota archaeon]